MCSIQLSRLKRKALQLSCLPLTILAKLAAVLSTQSLVQLHHLSQRTNSTQCVTKHDAAPTLQATTRAIALPIC